MMLFRIQIIPQSPWRTPWQADTLVCALCTMCARIYGADFLRERILEPMLAGKPPFVLSDAFPGDKLPLPVVLRLKFSPSDANYKNIQRGRWLTCDDFFSFCATDENGVIPRNPVFSDRDVLLDETTQHNTLSRDSDASIENGGCFALSDTLLKGETYLTLYFRAADKSAANLFLDLLHELALTGFGADVTTGRGQFEIPEDPKQMDSLLADPAETSAVICLSTFQPGPNDPTDGFWEAFPKFGKLGPDLGLADVRKHTLIMFRPGACFHVTPPVPYMGRVVPMDQLLPSNIAETLRASNIEVCHPAFGLTVPAKMVNEHAVI